MIYTLREKKIQFFKIKKTIYYMSKLNKIDYEYILELGAAYGIVHVLASDLSIETSKNIKI